MIRILIIFLIVGAGVIIGPELAGEQGIAFFQFAGHRIKMSFTTFILLQALFFLFLYFIYWLLGKIFGTSSFISDWFQFRSPKKSLRRIEQAQLFLLEGNYKKAGKLFSQGAKSSANSSLTYLQAAQAAIDSNELLEANQLLEQATENIQKTEIFAFKLVQLRLQIKNGELSAAKLMIEKLLASNPRHPEVLRLADQVYYITKDYQAIINLLPAMYKAEIYSEEQLDQFKIGAYMHRIKQLAESDNNSDLKNWWKSQPRAIRSNIIYQKEVANYLSEQGFHIEAQKLLANIEKNN